MRARFVLVLLSSSIGAIAQQTTARAQVCVPIVAQQVTGHVPFAAELRGRNKHVRAVRAEASLRPHHYLVLLDQSGSSLADVESYRYIVRRIAAELPDYTRDDLAVAAFQEQAGIVVPFTHKKEEVEAVLPQLGGQHHTALMDALYLASVTGATRAEQDRGITDVILISDADDNASRRSVKEVKQQINRSGVRLSALLLGDFSVFPTFSSRHFDVDDMSAATGGDTVVLTAPAYLQTATTLLIDELRDAHTLCFEADHSPDGEHEIKVKASKGWRIRYPKKLREIQPSVAVTRQASMR